MYKLKIKETRNVPSYYKIIIQHLNQKQILTIHNFTYHLKDFHDPGTLGHHKQLLLAPMQAFHQKYSKHHLDSEITEY